MHPGPRWLVFAIVTAALAGCRPDSRDDAFARAFIENVRTRSPAGARQLEPGTEISLQGWERVMEVVGAQLPSGAPDSTRLVGWESIRDDEGRARKLTYHVYGTGRVIRVEVWLVRQGDRTYVNTVAASAAAP